MPKKGYLPGQREIELLEKLLVVQLYGLGIPKGQIGKVVGRQKLWVTAILKGIPKGEAHGKGQKKKGS